MGLEPANEQASRDSSNTLHRYLPSDISTQNPRSAGYSHDLPELDAWNIADVDASCVQKPVSAQCGSLDSILGLPDFTSDAEEAEHISTMVKRRSLRRRSSSLSDIDGYQRHFSVPSSKRGSDSPANEALEVLPTQQRFPADKQVNSRLEESVRKLSTPTAKRSLGKRPSELRNRRIAVMMCPRPYGYRSTAHENHSLFRYIRFSDRRSLPYSGEESKPIRSCTTRESELYTFRGLPDAVQVDSGDEFCKLSYSRSQRNNSSAVDKRMLHVGLDTAKSHTSVIYRRESSEQVEQPFQASRNFQNSAQIKSPGVPQRILKTVAIKPCIATRTVMSEPSPTWSSRGGDLKRRSLSKSVHQNSITQFQQTAKPCDVWWKYPDLEEIKRSEPDKKVSVQSSLNDDLLIKVPPPMSSIAMTNPHPPSHNPLQPRLSQASATHLNTLNLEHPFSYSSSILCSKEAILKQSRKGWSTRCNNQDLD